MGEEKLTKTVWKTEECGRRSRRKTEIKMDEQC